MAESELKECTGATSGDIQCLNEAVKVLGLDACAPSPSEAPKTMSAMSTVLNMHELLVEIFMSCLMTRGRYSVARRYKMLNTSEECWYPRPFKREAPLLLTYICKFWRSVALSTPRIWAYLQLEIPEPLLRTQRGLEGQETALQFWLARSRSIPISIRLCYTPQETERTSQLAARTPPQSKALLDRLIRTLFEHTHRWENIEICLPEFERTVYDKIFQESAQVPHLISLRYNNSNVLNVTSTSEALVDGMGKLIHSAPDLEQLALSGSGTIRDVFAPAAFPSSLQTLELSLTTMHITNCMHGSHLRKLVLSDVNLTTAVISMFPTAFPFLEELVLVYSREAVREHGSNTHENIDSVTLNHLTCLTLQITSTLKRVHTPVKFISAPSLKSLTVSSIQPPEDFVEHIVQFLRRSKARVEHFQCEETPSAVRGYARTARGSEENGTLLMLREMSYLSVLKIFGVKLEPVMEYLLDPCHLPRLMQLYSEDCNSDDVHVADLRTIVKVVIARCKIKRAPHDHNMSWLQHATWFRTSDPSVRTQYNVDSAMVNILCLDSDSIMRNGDGEDCDLYLALPMHHGYEGIVCWGLRALEINHSFKFRLRLENTHDRCSSVSCAYNSYTRRVETR